VPILELSSARSRNMQTNIVSRPRFVGGLWVVGVAGTESGYSVNHPSLRCVHYHIFNDYNNNSTRHSHQSKRAS